MTSDSIEFHHEDEWIAVYLNGKLQRVGDGYLADEWLRQRAGVKDVYDDAFMRGGKGRTDVAQTLDEVEAYREERDRLLAEAKALREQAAELEARASAVAQQAGSARV